ncbi:nucleoside diphosphate kinase homolog 5-like isoform X2 [Stegostoma tigrinum]|uniref:nucleoside diphosphate kinase homolog 5-like isoform X2 n=1 Tax=Stegostoma tigrinum TaxID=3053191 RepID=UPI00202B4C4E|nr:nucleoside diphosphate kinase homolog 5-like isoform X2 [Stegostoma tigrinum]XP_048376186.1 nucleoside diphosphate kinase homolog 5-like isoform X2 [Stegostoma tigrinum]XP_059495537.1 nucleoside diphosphate kinase homolog 5-like isoform X2 [Stegostoma tigrinum]XP_059495538.1 nucleoside diphosphate kinase homolog 5-like isoform X2 [Stegostoma tigrinum]XP_059495539.1 nucleoside diphosphate kinase homolog 5-like isoform X2 [Stegostoma tigrinum]XP_059500368.1 nucleoside diphosphate kinase homol
MSNVRIFVECTLAIIKPDAVDKETEIEEIILRAGFSILQRRKLQLSPEQASEFYAVHSGKMFYPSLTAHLCSGPLVAMILARHSAIKRWNELLGPIDSEKAKETHPKSLRAIYGTNKIKNALHGSGCFNTAEREINFMFPNVTIEPFPAGQAAEDYLSKYVNPTLLTGLTQLCKEKPSRPIKWLADWLLQHNPNGPAVNEGEVKEPEACVF